MKCRKKGCIKDAQEHGLFCLVHACEHFAKFVLQRKMEKLSIKSQLLVNKYGKL